jgi:ubiquinone biosynthesis protein
VLDLSTFVSPDQLGALISGPYARYRQAVVEGVAFFLGQLPLERLAAIHAAQAALPPGSRIEQRITETARFSPVLHKLGQVLARDRRLPLELRRALQHLESMPPSVGPEVVKGWVEAEIGPLGRHQLRFDGPPLAEASVAIVTPFVSTREGAPFRGVFKVLKPGIEARLDEDLRALEATGAWLDRRCDELGLPPIAYQATFNDVSRLLAREVDLQTEQDNLALAGGAFADVAEVVIPEPHPASTARMTAMGRIDGRKVTALDVQTGAGRGRLARLIADALAARPLWSPHTKGVFHADPHAGNLMVTPEGRLAILDWALTGVLWKHERIPLTQILVGAATLDGRRIVAAIEALSRTPLGRAALEQRVHDGLQQLSRRGFPGVGWLTDLLDGVALEAGGQFSPDLVLFRKSFHTLQGVMADVDGEVALDGAIALRLMNQLTAEAGPRWLSHPLSRQFGSHLSNIDLIDLLMYGPLAPYRLWWR